MLISHIFQPQLLPALDAYLDFLDSSTTTTEKVIHVHLPLSPSITLMFQT